MFVSYRYVYLIAYTAEKGAYGRAIYPLDRKIKRIEDITRIERFIAEEGKLEKVSIMSYQLICKEMVKDERN